MHCNNRDISVLCWFITTSNRRPLITTELLSKLLLESAPLETWREEGEGQGNRHRVSASCVLDLTLSPSHWWGNSKSLSNLQKVAQLANYRDNIQPWPESSQSPFLLHALPLGRSDSSFASSFYTFIICQIRPSKFTDAAATMDP